MLAANRAVRRERGVRVFGLEGLQYLRKESFRYFGPGVRLHSIYLDALPVFVIDLIWRACIVEGPWASFVLACVAIGYPGIWALRMRDMM